MQRGPIQEDSDARAWSGTSDTYPFEVRAETFVYGADAATGCDEPLRLEAGDTFVDAETDGATEYRFRCAERTTGGTWTLVWDKASSNPHDDGRVASGGPGAWAMKLREGRLVPVDEYREGPRQGVERL
jgi:hypothetical protein